MATQHRIDTRTRTDGRSIIAGSDTSEPAMRDLLKQLAGEGSELLRNEMALAKLEMRDMARGVAVDSAKLGAALGLALVGALALVTAVIIGLGHLLDERFGLSALIVGVVFLAIGGVLAKKGMNGLKGRHGPEQTMQTLREDKAWAAREARDFKEEIRS